MAIAALGPLFVFSFMINVAADPALPEQATIAPGRAMTSQEQRATMQPLIRSANECVARAVSTDTRFSEQLVGGEVNELIVESVPFCLDPVRALIDAHDRLYGTGTGESFFMGPYLDALPTAVLRLVRQPAR